MDFNHAQASELDCVQSSNFILDNIVNLNLNEQEINDMSLSSSDLLVKDEANLIILNDITNFSNELFKMIKNNKISDFVQNDIKINSIDSQIKEEQILFMNDITSPLNDMFSEFANIITEKIA